MNENKILLSIAVASILLTGCSMKDSVNKTYQERSGDMLAMGDGDLRAGIHEKKVDKQFILTQNKKVSEALEEISSMTDKTYLLQGGDLDLPHAPNYKNIRDFPSLQEYVEDTTNKTLEITKNKFTKERVKVVQVKDKEAVGKELKDQKFNLKPHGGDVDLKGALQRFSEVTGLSIVYGNNPKTLSSTATNGSANELSSDLSTKIVSYNGVTAQQFLNYIQTSFDLYVDVDYVNKICKIEKYRLKEFPLMITNRVISKNGNTMLQSQSSNSSSNTESNSVQSKIESSGYEAFSKTIAELVTNINAKSGDTNLVSIDANTGIVSIFATNSAMQVLEDKVKNFNKSYMANGYATITIFELIVNNKITAGTDITYSNPTSVKNTTIDATTSLTSVLNNSLTIANASSGSRSLEVIAKSLSEMGYISKKSQYGTKFRNHVPSTLKELQVTNYVKNTTTNVTSNTSTTTSTATETEQIVAGSESILLPKINGDIVSIYVSLSDTVIQSLTKETYGTSQITIPVTKPRAIDDEFVLKQGESQVIRHITVYEDADNYKGVVPLKDFILGGEKNKELVRKELIYVLTIDTNNS